MTGAEQVPAKQDKASITKFLTTKTTDEMFNSPGQLAAAVAAVLALLALALLRS